MSNVAESDALLLWKMFYAKRSFEHARAACEHILANSMDTEHPLYYPLITAIHVHYARPFRKSRGVGKLSDDIIPSEYMDLHTPLLELRDTTIAHSDSSGPLIGTRPANEVHFEVLNGNVQLLLKEVKGMPSNVERIKALCEILIGKTNYHVDKLVKKHLREIPAKDGEYLLNIDSSKPGFVIAISSRY